MQKTRKAAGKGLRVVALAGLLASLQLLMATQAQAVNTISQTGSPGTFGGFFVNPPIGCSYADNGPLVAPRYVRSIAINNARINRSPLYATSTQTLWTRHTLQYFSGTAWVNARNSGWVTTTAAPNQSFESRGITFNIYSPGWSWRIRTEYVWSLGTTLQLGTVTNSYSVADFGRYAINGATGGVDPYAITLSTSQGAGYCTIR